MRYRLLLPRALVLTAAISLGASAQNVVNVLLLKPWGLGASSFNAPNPPWSTFGTTTLNIINGGPLPVTLASLLNANPDILFLSDPAGFSGGFSAAEITAIQSFLAIPGKRLIGTFLTFQYTPVNNLALLPLFGLTPQPAMSNSPTGNATLTSNASGHFLLNGIGATLTTGSYSFRQTPTDFAWDANDYLGINIASSTENMSFLHYWSTPTYEAIYFSFMPEFAPSLDDLQLLHNAMTRDLGTFITNLSPQGPAIIGGATQFQINSPGAANQPYLAALSLGTTPGFSVGSGRTIPLNIDWLFTLSLTPNNGVFLNNFGTLDASGATASPITLLIPNNPQLLGITIYGAAAVGGGPPPSGIRSSSVALPITFQ